MIQSHPKANKKKLQSQHPMGTYFKGQDYLSLLVIKTLLSFTSTLTYNQNLSKKDWTHQIGVR